MHILYNETNNEAYLNYMSSLEIINGFIELQN